MPAELTLEAKVSLVTRRQTVMVNDEDMNSLRSLLATKACPRIGWVTAPTGKPHVGYFVPLAKLIDFLNAGLEVTICYLDVYAFLVNYVDPMELVEYRRRYYHYLISAVLRSLGADVSKIRFMTESSFSYSKEFVTDVLQTSSLMTQQDAKDTCEEVGGTKMLSPLLCCVYQTLSEQYLDLDIHFGGEDQRGLFLHAVKYLPLLGYRKREHLMNVMVTGLRGGKMSSSHSAETKIEFLDDPDTVRKKIEQLPCSAGDAENTILSLLRDVILPISQQRVDSVQHAGSSWETEPNNKPRPFVTEDSPRGSIFSVSTVPFGKFGHYKSFTELQDAFVRGEIQPKALKLAVIDAFNSLLHPIRAIYFSSEEWQSVEKLAYPD